MTPLVLEVLICLCLRLPATTPRGRVWAEKPAYLLPGVGVAT